VYSHSKSGSVNRNNLTARYTNGQKRAATAVRVQDKRHGIYLLIGKQAAGELHEVYLSNRTSVFPACLKTILPAKAGGILFICTSC